MQIRRLTFNEYPLLLRQISRPPSFLDISGTPIPSDNYKFLCVVGARNFTQYGAEVCKHLIAGLKGYPIVIVSGLAIGIDSLAHELALNNDLKTIAFPGSGLDEEVLYPRSKLGLARQIVSSNNCLISPFEKNQASTPWTFPVRNRLMAGISHATLVIEGRVGSGTLLTARHALEFNRDVLIVPGSIFSDLSYGPHSLYKEGAIPITSSEEILNVLGLETNSQLTMPNEQLKQRKLESLNLSIDEKKIFEIISLSSISISDLVKKSAFSVIKLNIILSQLELNGLIEIDNGIVNMI